MKDLTGQRFGMWTVLGISPTIKDKRQYWNCKCDCGTIREVSGHSLTLGYTHCCGCINRGHNTFDLSGEYGIGYDKNNHRFFFSLSDYELIKKHYWGVKRKGYVTTEIPIGNRKYKQLMLHRYLMNPDDNQEIDHINHQPFDNRRENLRIVTTMQNQMNTRKSTRNTSGVKGVDFNNDTGKWRARIQVNGKRLSLGQYENFEDAVKTRKEAEKKYYGEYRYKEDADICIT